MEGLAESVFLKRSGSTVLGLRPFLKVRVPGWGFRVHDGSTPPANADEVQLRHRPLAPWNEG